MTTAAPTVAATAIPPVTTPGGPSTTSTAAPRPAPQVNLLFGTVTERNVDPRADGRDVTAAIAGANAMSVALYRAVVAEKPGRNVVLGPYSTLFALGMTYGGARGKTEAEMASVLGATALPGERWHAAINAYDLTLQKRLAELGRRVDHGEQGVDVASTPRCAELPRPSDRPLRRPARHRRVRHAAGTRTGAHQRLGGEQNARTHHQLFPTGTITEQTVLVLVNAIALDAPWNVPFDPKYTRPGQFTTSDNRVVTVPMMRNDEYLPSASGADFVAVELPYRGGHLVLDVIVPNDFA